MVAMAPNRAVIAGRVVGFAEPADLPNFTEVAVEVGRIDSIEGSRNLFRQAPGDTVKVMMPRAVRDRLGVRPGDRIELEARRADLHRAFAHPERIRVVRDEPSVDNEPRGRHP
jgi:hypothetical protein